MKKFLILMLLIFGDFLLLSQIIFYGSMKQNFNIFIGFSLFIFSLISNYILFKRYLLK